MELMLYNNSICWQTNFKSIISDAAVINKVVKIVLIRLEILSANQFGLVTSIFLPLDWISSSRNVSFALKFGTMPNLLFTA